MRKYQVSDRQAETSYTDGKGSTQEKKRNTVLITDDTTIYEIDAECLREKDFGKKQNNKKKISG